jgi:hypothetical protein
LSTAAGAALSARRACVPNRSLSPVTKGYELHRRSRL